MGQTVTDGLVYATAEYLVSSRADLYIAIGQGLSSWDTEGTPDPESTVSALISQQAEAPIADICYLDQEGMPTDEPTPRVMATSARFSAEEYEGAVRECGLFLGTGRSRRMLMYSAFPRVDITPQISLTKNMAIALAPVQPASQENG